MEQQNMRIKFALILCLFSSLFYSYAVDSFSYQKTESVFCSNDGPCIDLGIHKNILWAIGGGKLRSFSLEKPSAPSKLAEIAIPGLLRQIAFYGNYAYVSAREDGLFVVDISKPSAPKIVYHYDSLEKATGIAVSYPLLAIADRYQGVELVDISNPANPVYLSTCLERKEIQSVDLNGKYLVAGGWAESRIYLVDISNPRKPVQISEGILDGYGDGVRLRDGLCYAATGHHSNAFKKHHFEKKEASDLGYGEGQGLEIFSISEKAEMKRISSLKFPPFYQGYPDTWRVELSGNKAIVADEYNGVFLVDISKPEKMSVLMQGQAQKGKKIPELPEPFSAAVAGKDFIYTAGYERGIYVFPSKGMEMQKESSGSGIAVPTAGSSSEFIKEGESVRYRPDGQIRAAAAFGTDKAFIAAGNGGIHLLQLKPEFKVLEKIPTRGIVLDLALRGNTLCAAEAGDGLSVWDIDKSGHITEKGRYLTGGASLQQVVMPEGTPYVLVCNRALFEVLDISDLRNIKALLSESGPGLFYGKSIATELVNGKYASVIWHMGGPRFYDLSAKTPARADFPDLKGRPVDCVVVMPGSDKVLLLHGNGYTVFSPGENIDLGKPASRLASGENVNGKASLCGNILFTVAGAWKIVRALDVSNPAKPEMIKKWDTKGNPFPPAAFSGFIFMPEGREGILISPESLFNKK